MGVGIVALYLSPWRNLFNRVITECNTFISLFILGISVLVLGLSWTKR
jgi:hypothetical protein